MGGVDPRMIPELSAICESLASAAETGAARARRAQDVILRGRWLAIAAARSEHRERVAARLLVLGGAPPPRPSRTRSTTADLPTLLRADLAASHALSARCRRLARLGAVLGDTASAALCERLAAENLGHAAELARALALLYAREARTAAH